MDSGVDTDAQRFTTFPFLSTKNISKFHYRRNISHRAWYIHTCEAVSIPWYGLNPKGRPSRSSAICKLRWRCHHLHPTSSSGGMLHHNWWSKSSGSLQQNLVLGKTWRPRASIPRIDVRGTGVWRHTWLQGKPRTTSPLSLYLSYRAWSPR